MLEALKLHREGRQVNGSNSEGRLRLKCDGTRAETRFRLSTKRTSQFKSAGPSVQSTTRSRGVRISGSNGSNAGYTVFRRSVKSTGYPLHSPVSPSLPHPCATVCHRISTGLYNLRSHLPEKWGWTRTSKIATSEGWRTRRAEALSWRTGRLDLSVGRVDWLTWMNVSAF